MKIQEKQASDRQAAKKNENIKANENKNKNNQKEGKMKTVGVKTKFGDENCKT